MCESGMYVTWYVKWSHDVHAGKINKLHICLSVCNSKCDLWRFWSKHLPHAYKLTIDANRSTSCTNTCKYTYMHIYMHCGKCALAHTTLCAECRIRTHDLLIQVVHKSPATIGQLRGSCQKPYGFWAHIHTCIHTCIQLWFQFCTDKLTHAIFSFTIYLVLFIIHPRAEAEWWRQNTSFTRSVILSFPKVDSSQTSKQSINLLSTSCKSTAV